LVDSTGIQTLFSLFTVVNNYSLGFHRCQVGTWEDVVGATTAVLDAMMTTVLVVAAETGTTMITVAGVEEDIVMTVVDDALAAVVVVQHTVVAAAGKLDVSAKCFFSLRIALM
jgi:hypothetical protein